MSFIAILSNSLKLRRRVIRVKRLNRANDITF